MTVLHFEVQLFLFFVVSNVCTVQGKVEQSFIRGDTTAQGEFQGITHKHAATVLRYIISPFTTDNLEHTQCPEHSLLTGFQVQH